MLQAHQNGVDRHALILEAAERCFVRAGFHRTTMQDVAAEAGMSAGDLYRYVPSKDAIVVGLSERDQRDVAESFDRAPDRDPAREVPPIMHIIGCRMPGAIPAMRPAKALEVMP